MRKVLLITAAVLAFAGSAHAEMPTKSLMCVGQMAVNEDNPNNLIVHILRSHKKPCRASGDNAEEIREGCAMDSRCTVKAQVIVNDGSWPTEEIFSVDSVQAEVR
jgi:hypothetical protein